MVYVFSFEGVKSGGPELLHQLVYILNAIGVESKIVYLDNILPPSIVKGEPIDIYEKYQCEIEWRLEEIDQEGNVVVLPEIGFDIFALMKKAKKVAWWLSVDGYKDALKTEFNYKDEDFSNFDCLDPYHFHERQDVLHLVQSYYAEDFLKRKIGISEEFITYLSDYINDLYLQDDINIDEIQRKNMVLFNPKKGGWRLKKLMDATMDTFLWIPLTDMTREKMRLHMLLAKVYVDFGNHPGKDRIPREAAISGCCVITGRRGAANYEKDNPIPDQYKFDDAEDVDVEAVRVLIQDIFDHYEEHAKDFQVYRDMIRSEKERFILDAMRIFKYDDWGIGLEKRK